MLICYYYVFNLNRIRECTQVDEEYYYVVHHEMGHVEYLMSYRNQPFIFRNGANHAFHESIGDTIALSVSSLNHLKTIGILDTVDDSYGLLIFFLFFNFYQLLF